MSNCARIRAAKFVSRLSEFQASEFRASEFQSKDQMLHSDSKRCWRTRGALKAERAKKPKPAKTASERHRGEGNSAWS